MSEAPQREQFEQALIRDQAYRLWEERGRSSGQELDAWLDAEAFLQAAGSISRRPMAYPFQLKITMPDPNPGWRPGKVVCPVPGPNEVTFFEVSRQLSTFAYATPELLPGTLAHDHRWLLLQISAAVGALDRIARLLEWVSEQDDPHAPFLVRYPSLPFPILAPGYIEALFTPGEEGPLIAQLDSIIGDRPVSSTISMDITGISLGSWAEVRAKLFSLTLQGLVAGVGVLAPSAYGYLYTQGYTQQVDHRSEMERAIRAELSAGHVRPLQVALKFLGFDPGRIDGVYGDRTRRAADAFALQHHIPNDWMAGRAMIASVLARETAARATQDPRQAALYYPLGAISPTAQP